MKTLSRWIASTRIHTVAMHAIKSPMIDHSFDIVRSDRSPIPATHVNSTTITTGWFGSRMTENGSDTEPDGEAEPDDPDPDVAVSPAEDDAADEDDAGGDEGSSAGKFAERLKSPNDSAASSTMDTANPRQ